MNKKGDIGLIMLFFVALFFSIMLLGYFLMFNSGFDDKSAEVSALMKEVNFNQKYVIAKSEGILRDSIICDSKIYGASCNKEVKDRYKDIAEKQNYNFEGQGNFFGEVRNGKFSLTESGNYILEVNDLFVSSKLRDNSVNRQFKLVIEMDGEGKLIKKEIIPKLEKRTEGL